MSNVIKTQLNDAISTLFFEHFRDNIDRFNKRMPSILVDGSIQPYSACLPDHISAKLRQETQNHV